VSHKTGPRTATFNDLFKSAFLVTSTVPVLLRFLPVLPGLLFLLFLRFVSVTVNYISIRSTLTCVIRYIVVMRKCSNCVSCILPMNLINRSRIYHKNKTVCACFSSHCRDLCNSLTYTASTEVHTQYSP
jgi:hypothetical protein